MIFKRKRKIITGVEITKNWLKIAQAYHNDKGVKFIQLAAEKITGQTDEQISGRLAEIFNSSRISKNYIVTSVPYSQTAIRFLKLPSTNKEEITRMIDFHAVKEIPYSQQDTIADFQIINFDEKGYARVLLAIIHKDIAQRLLKIFGSAGLKIEKIMFSSQAVSETYLKISPPSDQTVLLIDIGFSTTHLELIGSGGLIFSRSLSVGSQYLLEYKIENFQDNPWMKLLNEISRFLDVCRRKKVAEKVDKAVLFNPNVLTAGLREIFSEKFSFPLEDSKLLECLSLGKGVSPDKNFKEKALSLSSLTGLIYGAGTQGINLLPKNIRIRKANVKLKKNRLTALALILGIVLTLGGIYFKKLHEKKSYLKQLELNINKISSETKKIETMLEQMQIVRERVDPALSSIEIIRELYKIIPEGISLTQLALEGKENLALRGSSFSMSDVFKLGTALEKSIYFKNIKIKYASKRKIRGKEMTDFQITCVLASSKEGLE